MKFWRQNGVASEINTEINKSRHAERFYGKSLPFDVEKSYQHPQVDLLTVEQALADFAVFLDWFKASTGARQSPVIAFGGSYGGMLSAYMRFKYPNLISGSLAASAPIYLAAGVSSRRFFFEDVTQDFKNAVSGCADVVREGFRQMFDVISQGKQGLQQISRVFNLCEPLKRREQVRHLVGWIRNAFTYFAMLDYPYPTMFISALPGNPVKVACNELMKSDDPLSGLATAAALWYGKPSCNDIWSDYIECADPTGCGTGVAGMSWSYQACTDFVMPDGTYNETDMFPYQPFTLEQRTAFCQKRWNITPPGNWTRINLWGRDIKAASNIVFSNGKLDPWHRGGVLQDISDTVVAIVIDAAAHHLDLRSSNPHDPPSVIKARRTETDWIHRWIQNWKYS